MSEFQRLFEYRGSERKTIYMGPNVMRSMRWLIRNRAFKYRKGKSGKLIMRKGDTYDSYIDWKTKGMM